MPIIEYLITNPAGLAAPGGVTFPKFAEAFARARDTKMWEGLMPELFTHMKMGYYIMALILPRSGVAKPWNAAAMNFEGFNADEDALIGAYVIHKSLGNPYRPGLCSNDFAENLGRQGQASTLLPFLKSSAPKSGEMFQIFHPDNASLRLQYGAVGKVLEQQQKTGSSFSDAMRVITRPEICGWRGGNFPPLVNRPPHRM